MIMYIVPLFTLIAGLWGLPSYSWYIMLRIVVALQALIYALLLWLPENKYSKFISVFYIAIAIIFFPALKVGFGRSEWQVLDIFVAIIFIASNLYIDYLERKSKQSNTQSAKQTLNIFTFKNILLALIAVLTLSSVTFFALYKYEENYTNTLIEKIKELEKQSDKQDRYIIYLEKLKSNDLKQKKRESLNQMSNAIIKGMSPSEASQKFSIPFYRKNQPLGYVQTYQPINIFTKIRYAYTSLFNSIFK